MLLLLVVVPVTGLVVALTLAEGVDPGGMAGPEVPWGG